MPNTLFGAKLNSLNPGALLRTEARPHPVARQLADAASQRPPTNQEILEVARTVYHAHSAVIDVTSSSGLQYANSSEGQPVLAALNSYNWKSGQVGPITPTAEQVYTAPLMKPAVDAATNDPDIRTLVIGIIGSGPSIIGEQAGVGVGVGFALAKNAETKGVAYTGGQLGLEAPDLMLGLWNAIPAELAGDFYGLGVSLSMGTDVSVGIFLRRDLTFYGFSMGIGVGIGAGATIVAGHAWVF